MKNSLLKFRLTVMNFLEFAVWGAYLTSLGTYLASHGLGNDIGSFYVIQGIVSIFMPGLMGIVADRWVPSQRLLGICHFLAGGFMIAAASYGLSAGDHVEFSTLFTYYALSVAFYMPTLALSNAVAFNGLHAADGSHFFPRVAQHALVPQGGVAYAHPAVHKTAHIFKQMDGAHSKAPRRAGLLAGGVAWR